MFYGDIVSFLLKCANLVLWPNCHCIDSLFQTIQDNTVITRRKRPFRDYEILSTSEYEKRPPCLLIPNHMFVTCAIAAQQNESPSILERMFVTYSSTCVFSFSLEHAPILRPQLLAAAPNQLYALQGVARCWT